MEIKLFEIRDRGTFIPAMAVKPVSDNMVESWILLGRSGFNRETHCIYLIHLGGQQAKHDAYEWGNSRTMHEAHKYIEQNFDTLQSGDVIDVEFILGETTEKKISERYL